MAATESAAARPGPSLPVEPVDRVAFRTAVACVLGVPPSPVEPVEPLG